MRLAILGNPRHLEHFSCLGGSTGHRGGGANSEEPRGRGGAGRGRGFHLICMSPLGGLRPGNQGHICISPPEGAGEGISMRISFYKDFFL